MDENIQWIFSGIGTYVISAFVAFVCFLIALSFRRKSNSKNSTNVKGDNFKIEQKGWFNKLKFSHKSKKK